MIKAPPEKIWSFISDIKNFPKWMDMFKEVKVTSEKRVGVGTTSRWVGEVGGTRTEVESEVTEFAENEKIAWRSTYGDMTGFGSVTLKPVEGGTKVTYLIDYELPHSIFGEIVVKVIVDRDIEKGVERGLQNLKNLLEK